MPPGSAFGTQRIVYRVSVRETLFNYDTGVNFFFTIWSCAFKENIGLKGKSHDLKKYLYFFLLTV